MGNSCSCFNEDAKNTEIPVAKSDRNVKGMVITSKYKDPESQKMITKIQAVMRSFLALKKKQDKLIEKAKILKLNNSKTKKLSPDNGSVNFNANTQALDNDDSIESYDNEIVRQITQNLGDFEYEECCSISYLPPWEYDYRAKEEDNSTNKNIREFRPRVKFENGCIYEGEWSTITNLRDGRGIQIWPDGSRYEGHWKDDKANGKGRLIHADGDIYKGDWQDDKSHGYGIYLHNDGAYYQGEWANDEQNGYGIEEWPDGSKYEGNYKDGKNHGHGTFIWPDGSKYTGEFVNNEIEGNGTYEWPDGRNFNGEWKANKMHGKGIFKWPDGRSYEGEYKNDVKEGHGIFKWKDGKKNTSATGLMADNTEKEFLLTPRARNMKENGIMESSRILEEIMERLMIKQLIQRNSKHNLS